MSENVRAKSLTNSNLTDTLITVFSCDSNYSHLFLLINRTYLMVVVSILFYLNFLNNNLKDK